MGIIGYILGIIRYKEGINGYNSVKLYLARGREMSGQSDQLILFFAVISWCDLFFTGVDI